MKVAHKGLIVVSVPLLFQLVFVYHLSCLVNDSHRQFESELTARDSIIQANRFMNSLMDASIAGVAMVYSGDNRARQLFNRIMASCARTLGNLKSLTKDPSQLQRVQTIENSSAQLLKITLNGALTNAFMGGSAVEVTRLTNRVGLELRFFTDFEEEKAKYSVDARRAIHQQLYQALILGLVADVLLTIMMALIFTGSISDRLEVAKESIKRLGKHEVPEELLTGDDEIALLNRSIYQSATALSEALQSKSDVMMIIKQQLQTPLSKLACDFDQLSGQTEKLSKNAIYWLNLSRQNLRRLLRMVAELLDNASGLHEKFALNLSAVSLSKLLSDSVALGQKFADDREISLRISVETDGVFSADPDLLCQVVLNLITNAVKFSDKGTEVLLRGVVTKDAVQIEVIDKGAGIAPQFVEKIFKPFQQVSEQDASVRKGTGLGLAICKAIVEQHKGTITVDSSPGKGSCFRLSFPQTVDNSRSADRQKDKKRTLSVRAQGLILVLVPLIVTGSFISFLLSAQAKLDRDIEHELRAKRAISGVNQIIIHTVNAARALAAVRIVGDNQKKTHDRNLRLVGKQIKDLRELLFDDPTALHLVDGIDQKLNKINALIDKLLMDSDFSINTGAVGSADLVSELNKSKDISRKLIVLLSRTEYPNEELREQSFQSLNRILPAALLISFVVTALSSSYFSRRIAGRLDRLRDGVEQLQAGTISIPPTDEEDEIGLLQNYFCQTATRLVELEQFRGYVVGVVSHEMKTPLQTILGAIDLLESGAAGQLEPESEQIVKSCGPRTKRIIKLVHELLDIEKIHSGTFTLSPEPTTPRTVCDTAKTLLRDVAAENGVSIDIDASDDVVIMDKERLLSVLATLLENVIKYSGTSFISLTAEARDGQVFFELECQTGCMDDDLATPLIFEQFFRASAAYSHDSIFMHISRDILEQHGGASTCVSAIDPEDGSSNSPIRELSYTIHITPLVRN